MISNSLAIVKPILELRLIIDKCYPNLSGVIQLMECVEVNL